MRQKYARGNILIQLLGFNLVLMLCLVFGIYGSKYIKSSVMEYSNIKSDTFDGTSYPIAFIPDWTKVKNTKKSIDFASDNLGINDFVEIPRYDPQILSDDTGTSKTAILTRYTYPVVYMGDYKLDYQEFMGSHLAVDIRAPIGTPVLSIANGVVIKVKNDSGGDGKYVVIRHDDVKNGGVTETLYSAYEHLNDIFVEEGTKIKRGEVLGKVGMTGITTTPHLHFQVDKKAAPFHPYWPYSLKEASDIGLDFFGAIDAGLGKENAIAYTVNPMQFVQDNLVKDPILNSAPIIETVNAAQAQPTASIETPKLSQAPVADNNTSPTQSSTTVQTPTVTENPKQETPLTNIPDASQPTASKVSVTIHKDPSLTFQDIPKNSKLYQATKYLYDNGISKGNEAGLYKPENTLTRQEALIFIFKLYGIKTDSVKIIPFVDISKNAFIVPYLQKGLEIGLISRNKMFRPNDVISRAEFVTMLIKASGKQIRNSGNAGFSDIAASDWYSPYVETFSSVFVTGSRSGRFEPNNTFDRGQVALILYQFSKSR